MLNFLFNFCYENLENHKITHGKKTQAFFVCYERNLLIRLLLESIVRYGSLLCQEGERENESHELELF